MRNRYCLLLSTIAFLSVMQPTEAQISPDGTTATQVNGNAIAPIGAGTVNGGNLYNSFNQFNVPQSGVIFNTGNSAVNGADIRNIINRVTGDNPSAILGTIESRQAFPNANLYLMNPNGIVFGQNARLDIGGSFHATTGTGLGFDSGTFQVDKNSLSFPSGDPQTIRFAIAQPAGIINQGNLAVDTGKTITFTGGSIINTGTLTAPSGNVALTAVVGNSQVELRSPDAVLGLQVTSNAVPTQWNGKITELPKLAELLTGKVLQADRVVVKADGSLALVATPDATDIAVTNGMAIVSGLVDVSSDVAKGGNVGIFGNQVGLVNAQINASGKTGGGTVLIGGDFQGKGIAPNALQAYVSPSSSILADGLFAGNGGKVIVWADDFTRFLGAISAKGGDISGDGGFVEVSGKQNLDFRGQVNTLAPKGVTGNFLLDPTDITISPSTIDFGGSLVGAIFVPSASVANISASTLLSLLTFSNVTISTASTFIAPLGGTITVNNDLSWSGGTTPNTSLTLIADNNIVINAAINVLGDGNFTAVANNNININGSSLTTRAGTLTLTATNGDIQIPSTTTLGSFTTGNIIFTAGNGISLGGQVLSTSGGFIELVAGNGGIASTATNGINSTAPSGNSGRISIDTTGSLTVTNGVISSSSIGNGGDILIGSTRTPTSVNIGSLSSFANGTTGNGGNVDIRSIGDIVLNSANTAGSTQGGNFTAISTGGNIRLLGLVSSPFATCAGASICSASNIGNTGGQISIRHGGINSFTVGDSSINGTAGIITTGSSTLALGTILPVGNSTFTQGNLIVFPYASPSNTIASPSLVDTLPVPIGKLVANNNADTTALLEIREIMKKDVDRFLKEDNLPKAFDAIEKAYVSELGIFLGEDLKPPVLSIDQAQELLSDASKRSGSVSALIYPIMLNNRIEILVIPPKELGKPFHRYTNYANEDEIINVLMEYRANLLDPDSQDYLVQAKKLYDWVMRPIDSQLQAMKIETVVFVMDSGLRVIPPAALYDGKQFLIERYASANIPALRVTRLEDRDRQNTRVLAMGLTEAREGLSALPSVEVEIRTIGTQVLSGATFLNQDFTVSNLQEQRGKANYGILHLGTHGQFLQDRAKDSYIQFWDSKLRSDQIPKLRFDQPVIDMLTLSACETAVGNNLGISGLAVESGARSILASLWKVSDVGTAPLMISFYKAFPDALSKATALRQAQLDLLKGKVKIENNQIVGVDGLAAIALPEGSESIDLRHPFFWSSFILVGNWL